MPPGGLLKTVGTTMKKIAEKSGNAFVAVGVVPSRRLRHLVPEPLSVATVLPGLSFYAVGFFHYAELRGWAPGQPPLCWRGVSDATVLVPVRPTDGRRCFYVARLCNSSGEVVEWAAAHGLGKAEAAVAWLEREHHVHLSAVRTNGCHEALEMKGRRLVRLPAWIWKIRLLRSFLDFSILTNDGRGLRRFRSELRSIGSTESWRLSWSASGIALPRPWLTLGARLGGFGPLDISDTSMPAEYFPAATHGHGATDRRAGREP
jgi:hypothetical protein